MNENRKIHGIVLRAAAVLLVMVLLTTGSRKKVRFPVRNSATSRILSAFKMPGRSKSSMTSRPMTLAGKEKGRMASMHWLSQ